MYLVINKWVTAVKVSNFSGHYLRSRSTLDIGVLGYIGIVQHKEHSPEVSHIPPGTSCIKPSPWRWTFGLEYIEDVINWNINLEKLQFVRLYCIRKLRASESIPSRHLGVLPLTCIKSRLKDTWSFISVSPGITPFYRVAWYSTIFIFQASSQLRER